MDDYDSPVVLTLNELLEGSAGTHNNIEEVLNFELNVAAFPPTELPAASTDRALTPTMEEEEEEEEEEDDDDEDEEEEQAASANDDNSDEQLESKPGLKVKRNQKQPPMPSFKKGEWRCSCCATTTTPQWRVGPNGPKTMCNACGIKWKRGNKKRKETVGSPKKKKINTGNKKVKVGNNPRSNDDEEEYWEDDDTVTEEIEGVLIRTKKYPMNELELARARHFQTPLSKTLVDE